MCGLATECHSLITRGISAISSSRSCIIELKNRRTGGYMAARERVEAHSTFSKIVVYATVISGFVAAYLMYKRGESMVAIARKTVTNPVGSLVSEVKNVV
jgi:hypothetical protein